MISAHPSNSNAQFSPIDVPKKMSAHLRAAISYSSDHSNHFCGQRLLICPPLWPARDKHLGIKMSHQKRYLQSNWLKMLSISSHNLSELLKCQNYLFAEEEMTQQFHIWPRSKRRLHTCVSLSVLERHWMKFAKKTNLHKDVCCKNLKDFHFIYLDRKGWVSQSVT